MLSFMSFTYISNNFNMETHINVVHVVKRKALTIEIISVANRTIRLTSLVKYHEIKRVRVDI